MLNLAASEVWFVTGSQHLYGPETLEQVAAHSAQIAAALDDAPAIPVRVVTKPVLTGSDGILALVREANADPACVGLITWMHTFSPAKMWIAGLEALDKPFLHLHTQFNREIPWADIDMDFMNLNQAAHGDREFGFIAARLRLERKVVVGHWGDALGPGGDRDLDACRVRQGRLAGREDRALRRQHARGRGHGRRQGRGPAAPRLLRQHLGRRRPRQGRQRGVRRRRGRPGRRSTSTTYDVAAELRPGGDRAHSLRDGARIELGLRRFLADGGFTAFTDTFEDLHGLKQLPGLAVQRLMADGYGFGGEGDWKTAAMVRAMKVMAAGPPRRHVVHGGLHLPPDRATTT